MLFRYAPPCVGTRVRTGCRSAVARAARSPNGEPRRRLFGEQEHDVDGSTHEEHLDAEQPAAPQSATHRGRPQRAAAPAPRPAARPPPPLLPSRVVWPPKQLPWDPDAAAVVVAWDLDNKRPREWEAVGELVRCAAQLGECAHGQSVRRAPRWAPHLQRAAPALHARYVTPGLMLRGPTGSW